MMVMFDNYVFTLTTLSPLRVGSGEKLDSKQYYRSGDSILVIDQWKLAALLHRRNKLDAYTDAIQKGSTLVDFMRDNSRVLPLSELKTAAQYILPVFDSPNTRGNPYLHLFQKGMDGRPYIPGSSLKGAIVASLLACYYQELFPEERRNAFEDAVRSLVKQYDAETGRAIFADRFRNEKGKWNLKSLDSELNGAFKTLIPDISSKTATDEQKRILYLLRAIRVSDSNPVEADRLAACGKADVYIEPNDERIGRTNVPRVNENNPGILHESLIPGTKIQFRLSIDGGCLEKFRPGMTTETCIEWIKTALNDFRAQQDFYFTDAFFSQKPGDRYPIRNAALRDRTDSENHFYFGAGTGIVNKTLLYPIFWGKSDAPDVMDQSIGFIAGFLDLEFKGNKHVDDVDLSVSPHKLKCVYYQGGRYLMGHCTFSIDKELNERKLL